MPTRGRGSQRQKERTLEIAHAKGKLQDQKTKSIICQCARFLSYKKVSHASSTRLS